MARPACRIAFARRLVQCVTRREDDVIVAGMALRRTHVADAAVTMLEVVPVHERGSPDTGCAQIIETRGRELRPVLRGAEQRLGVGVVVADPGSRVRGFDAQPVEHRQHRGGLERGTVITVQHRSGLKGCNVFSECRATHQVSSMFGSVAVVHLPAHDLAAVQVQDQIQVEPSTGYGCR